MGGTGALQRGHVAYAARAWAAAYEELRTADSERALDAGDLQLLGTAAFLTAHDADSVTFWARAFNGQLEQGSVEQAARIAFILSLTLTMRGEGAQASGWLARGRRLVEGRDCAEMGLLLMLEGLVALMGHDTSSAREVLNEALAIGDRTGDRDLQAVSRLALAQTLAEIGQVARGLSMLDEAMLSVIAGEVSPILSGLIYCACIVTCQKLFEIRRAQEWTSALTAWCAKQPDMVPYRGQCLVHRSQLLEISGDWTQAMEEARRACTHLAEPLQGAFASALYQRGELHRLLGDFDEAEQAYRAASEHGLEPQPGLSLLRMTEGRLDAAVAAMRHLVATTSNDGLVPGGREIGRGALLGPFVEIMIAAGDLSAARAAAEELDEIAARFQAPLLRAHAAHAWGAVLLAEGDAGGALERLRAAWTAWKEVGAPYEIARTRILLGLACRALDDTDTASMHFDAARATFETLGAVPDLERLQRLDKAAEGPLSARELEVLELIANGSTNREIANALVISERTVARHLSNIFTKLGVSSRTAAGAYAFKHHLV